jgi:rod shape-determining protein MreC
MGRPGTKRSTLLCAAAVVMAAAGLFIAPPRLQQTVRGAVLDVVVSGQALAMSRYDALRHSASNVAFAGRPVENAVSTAASDQSTRNLEQTCRKLRIENARLREELQLAEKYGVSPIAVPPRDANTSRATVAPEVVRAAVVSRQALAQWRTLRTLNQGRSAGISESSLVLEENSPHLDQGADAGIEPDLDVFIGRCVVGRIASVGRWTSTLESITDRRYRALVQIVRPTDQGGSFGTEGILVGQGNGLCKLTEVPTTETVRVGDEVYTSERDSHAGIPLYYGRIRSVEEAGRHWDITVEPAVKTEELNSVAVLKLPPNFARPLAQ